MTLAIIFRENYSLSSLSSTESRTPTDDMKFQGLNDSERIM